MMYNYSAIHVIYHDMSMRAKGPKEHSSRD